MLENLKQSTDDEELKDKLETAVNQAIDDDTYRKVKRMSYQSHSAEEVFLF